jgi:hypothetical protein
MDRHEEGRLHRQRSLGQLGEKSFTRPTPVTPRAQSRPQAPFFSSSNPCNKSSHFGAKPTWPPGKLVPHQSIRVTYRIIDIGARTISLRMPGPTESSSVVAKGHSRGKLAEHNGKCEASDLASTAARRSSHASPATCKAGGDRHG